MPLIQRPPEPLKKEALKVALESEIFNEITAYCNWANITVDHFIEQAALIIFRKDKSWKEYKASHETKSVAN